MLRRPYMYGQIVPILDGEAACRVACDTEESHVECASSADCDGGRACCTHVALDIDLLNPSGVDQVFERTACADDCGNLRRLCREDAQCEEGEQCTGISMIYGLRFCVPTPPE